METGSPLEQDDFELAMKLKLALNSRLSHFCLPNAETVVYADMPSSIINTFMINTFLCYDIEIFTETVWGWGGGGSNVIVSSLQRKDRGEERLGHSFKVT